MDNLREYIKQLFQCVEISRDIENQIQDFVAQGISERDIYNALFYWYTIKENDISKANGRIGIVPYILQQSKDYIEYIKTIREKHKDISITPKDKTVEIERPKTNNNIKLFDL